MAYLKSCYFHHDYNSSNDAKILFLRQQLGMEGYGIYWFILEQLAQAGGKLPIKIVPVLAMQSQTQESKVRAVIEGYELFILEDESFFSIRLNNHLDDRKMLSDMGKRGAENRWGKNRGAINGVNGNGISGVNSNKERNKEINKEKGFEFFSDFKYVQFKDGTFQKLGKDQHELAVRGHIKPTDILKGTIE